MINTNNKFVHYKGGIYTLLNDAVHTESGERLVIYSDEKGNIWARPSEMFYGLVELENGNLVYRFAKILKK